ncbi:zinc finger protein 777-like isoform X2 [Ambystoma mexicanum]|uniref:zinc finger protein 777-like isoform X2 n=1 Tax=Ambystoma mexicanum TaxID=8296 RepID=UPI0037E70594
MEIGHSVPRLQGSDKAPQPCHDFARHFSKEDWKLFRVWQAELYEMVMKEILQALTSLGPLIATSVFSLKPKERDEASPVDHQEPKKRGCGNPFPSDANTSSDLSLKKKRRTSQDVAEMQGSNEWESRRWPNPGFLFHSCDSALRQEAEYGPGLKEAHASEAEESPSGPLSGNVFMKPDPPFIAKVEENHCADFQGPERKEGVASAAAELSANTGVLSFKVKEEEEAYFVDFSSAVARERLNYPPGHKDITQAAPFIMQGDGITPSRDQQDSETRGSFHTPVDERPVKRKKDSAEAFKYTRKAPVLGTAKTKVFQSPQKGTGSQTQPEGYHELEEEMATLCDAGFMNSPRPNVHPVPAKEIPPDLYSDAECESVRRETILTSPPNGSLLPSTCERTYSPPGGVTEHQSLCPGLAGVHTEATGQHQCNEFQNNLGQMKNQPGAEGSLTVERPYMCPQCHKCFRNMSKFTRHRITHSKEKHYQCTECGKSYNRSDNLIRHQRSHTRDFQAQIETWATSVTPYDLQNQDAWLKASVQ